MSDKLRCPYTECDSCIVSFDDKRKTKLPLEVYETTKLAIPAGGGEANGEFLVFEDIWDFDNIGMSRPIPEELISGQEEPPISFSWEQHEYKLRKLLRYIICAECDKGPLGIVCEVENDEGNSMNVNLLSLASVRANA